jgi:glycosyltransferase involved in cell wall biosynthesis/peptidoglycan/xylan/chitin deacetylase (PgdA/CDA1 family)
MIAHALDWTGADRSIGRLSGVVKEPLILGYHRVLPDVRNIRPSPGVPSLDVSVVTLEKHLDFVGRRFRFVSLDELGARLDAGTAAGLAAVTFDDGYADFYDHAFPLLDRKGIPAAVFVVTGLLEDAGGFLHERLYALLEGAFRRRGVGRTRLLLAEKGFAVELPDRAFPALRMLLRSCDQETLASLCAALESELGELPKTPRSLSWAQLTRMSRVGLTVGSHTKTHALLSYESPDRVRHELESSRAVLEEKLGVRIAHFAYPDGCFDAATVRAVAAAGYRFAYTGCRHRDPSYPRLTLPRRVLWEGSTLGALGGFSPHVLSSQIHGIFDDSAGCPGHDVSVRRPRVALVGPSLDVLGGQSVQAAALVDGMRREGLDVAFVPTDPRFPAGLRRLRAWPGVRTVLNEALYLPSLFRLRGVDVVHVFSASFWSFLLAPLPAMLMARAFGARVILNYHSGEAEEHLGRWGSLVHPWLRRAHAIVVPSQYLRRVFAGHGYAARVVPNVVDTTRYAYRERVPLRPRLLSARNFERSYRVDVILSAFAILKASCPDATLTLAGCGREETRLRRMADPIGGVTFLGRVAPAAMPDLYAAGDVFLNASVVDNQPLSLLEAFASGLPVVTTATGGIAGMVRHGETGMLVPPLEPGAMAAAVRTLLSDESLALRIARAARRVAETHSWPCVRDQWTEVYSGRSVDAAPDVEDGDDRGRRSEPTGGLEVAREEGYEEPAVARAR